MSSIFKFTSIVLILSFISKALGLLRDVLLVGELGAGASTDIFYGAMNIIEFFILFSGLNAMKSVGTSTYTKVRNEEKNRTQYFTSLIFILVIYGTLISLLVYSLSNFLTIIFLPGFSEANRLIAGKFIRILSFMILFKGTSLILGNLMAVEKRFLIQSIFMPLTNIIVITTILLSKPEFLVMNMAMAILCSWIFSAFAQFVILSGFFKKLSVIKIDKLKEYGTLFFKTGYPLLFVTTTFALASSTDKIIASFFREGTITSINLANMICFMPLQLILVPISNVFFPHFSQLFHAGKIKELEVDFNKGQLTVSLIFIPVMVILLFWGRDIVEIAFLRKNFSQENLNNVSNYLLIYCFALLFNAYYTLTSFLFQGAQKNSIIGKIGVLGYAVNIIFSVLLSYLFKSPIGIPLGTVCAFIFFSLYTNLKVRDTFNIKIRSEVFYYSFIIGLVFTLMAYFIRWFNIQIPTSQLFLGKILNIIVDVLILVLGSVLILYPLMSKKILSFLKGQD